MKDTPAQRFAKLFALFINGATPGEREAAERKVNAWLGQHGKTERKTTSPPTRGEAATPSPRKISPTKPAPQPERLGIAGLKAAAQQRRAAAAGR
jgi:hypothetical protein